MFDFPECLHSREHLYAVKFDVIPTFVSHVILHRHRRENLKSYNSLKNPIGAGGFSPVMTRPGGGGGS
jgi:hypothetical protein